MIPPTVEFTVNDELIDRKIDVPEISSGNIQQVAAPSELDAQKCCSSMTEMAAPTLPITEIVSKCVPEIDKQPTDLSELHYLESSVMYSFRAQRTQYPSITGHLSSQLQMEGGSMEDQGAPESWEAADMEESMKRLMLSSATSKKESASSFSLASSSSSSDNAPVSELGADASTIGSDNLSSSRSAGTEKVAGGGLSEEAINQVDQFLREALQNPRERLSILRMEQDVEKFIRDPTQQQLEFQQLPTSYLRLAAHRVAQHYFLQSMVLLDNNHPDGSGSRIFVRKTSAECHLPRIRLADIPINLTQEHSGVVKVAIKKRPQNRSPVFSETNSNSLMINQSKSVEERNEEYNKARARIFNSSNHSGSSCANPENEPRMDTFRHGSLGLSKLEEKISPGGSDLSTGSDVTDFSTDSYRSGRSRTEKEPAGRYKANNKVAILRDREVDRKDPDYDRCYERYTQRFDPGFGFSTGPYAIQPMYTPAVNYNTEFPQLASTHRPQVSAKRQPRPLPQSVPGPWAASMSNPAGISYGHPETIMTAFPPSQHLLHNDSNSLSNPALFLQPSQYACQHPGMPFIHPHEHIHQPYSQSHQQQHDATLGLARPRSSSAFCSLALVWTLDEKASRSSKMRKLAVSVSSRSNAQSEFTKPIGKQFLDGDVCTSFRKRPSMMHLGEMLKLVHMIVVFKWFSTSFGRRRQKANIIEL
ncbi:hypothetical protein Nepgr_009717 [Nepenthes gracilis]|uniref:R3H domain-containing protein 2 n=1 Tax=Nepenthes gracilis TaxID=150966 RepID=A0AAD3SBT2_NEPGR|nr:hypothetical protein Nepgr_009717 [Nepenthes gracilis]